MANFIPSEALVRDILKLNMTDYGANSMPLGEGMEFVYTSNARVRDIQQRYEILDYVSLETFKKIFAEDPKLFLEYADLWMNVGWWLGDGPKMKIIESTHPIPKKIRAVIEEMLGVQEKVHQAPPMHKGHLAVAIQDAIEGYRSRHLVDSPEQYHVLSDDLLYAMRRKEAMWGPEFSQHWEARLSIVATWIESATQALLEANTPLEQPYQPFPKLLAKPLANIQAINELLSVEKDRIEDSGDDGSHPFTFVSSENHDHKKKKNRPILTVVSTPDLPDPRGPKGMLNIARWWQNYAVDNGKPATMEAATKIYACVQKLEQTPLLTDSSLTMLDLLDFRKISAVEREITLDNADQLQKRVTDAIRQIRHQRKPAVGADNTKKQR